MSNVPFLPGRSRYQIVGTKPTWVYHLGTLNGAKPLQAGKTADEVDPVVSAGRVEYQSLTEGGLFSHLGNYNEALVVEAVDVSGSVTLVTKDGTLVRNAPTAPFKVAPGEYLKVATGTKAGFLVRIDQPTDSF